MWAGVDAQAQAPLAAKLAAERDRYAAGQQQFETDRDAARADADGKIETLEADAATEQAAARDTAQAEVDTAREDWRAEVDQVEADARADADAAQAEHTTQIEQERTTADTEAAGHLTQAEKDAAAKTADAEEAAAAKKQEGEKESGGFWGWVKSKAKAFIDGIKSAVNAIYDGLRAAVTAVFEAAKALALAVIEAARKVIVGLIKALGELLKAIVKVALAAFPKLADKFCALIDAAVEKATTLVNTIADGLKAAVTAVLDFLASTLDKILSIVQDLYNAAFTLIGMLITGEWKAIVEGLGNLVAAAETAPGQFETAALEELLGGDLDQPLDSKTLAAAGRPVPGGAEGDGMASATDAIGTLDAPDAEMPREPWTEDNVGVDSVAHDYPLSPELMADIQARLGGGDSIEFGHSDDPDRSMSGLGIEPQPAETETATASQQATTPDDGLSPAERADVKWTLMKQGLAQWWSDNWPLVFAGGVLAIGGFIAANILTGGAVLAALPGLMTALGAVFAGVTFVHLVGHLRDYLEKGWAGDTQGGGKSLAKALAAVAVELLTWLTFKVGSVALKGAKTVAKGVSKGAQSLAKGASRAGKAIAGGVRRAGQYVIKQGKVLLKGIAGTALGRAAKRLDDFARGLLGKTRFKGFRIRVRQRWFILEGKINPWIPIAEGPFPQRQTLAKTSDEIDGVIAQLKASDRVGSAKIAGAETTSAHDLLDDIARRAKLGEHGAQGELAALERRVLKDGNDVDLLRAVEKGDDARFTRDGARSRGNKTGEPNPRTTPDIRTKGDTPELIDVKTAVKAPKNWKRWINDQIAKVHDQMKRSRLRSGRPGGADLQLFEEAAEAFSTLGRTEVDNFVKGAFNAHRGTSLNRVTIYCDGNVAAEYIRVGDIIKVVK